LLQVLHWRFEVGMSIALLSLQVCLMVCRKVGLWRACINQLRTQHIIFSTKSRKWSAFRVAVASRYVGWRCILARWKTS